MQQLNLNRYYEIVFKVVEDDNVKYYKNNNIFKVIE
jgi:hypothetical protein